MVGVPGKSKGCTTCRQRKKGCDQRRPICGNCESSGYVCGGYRRDLTFIEHPASKAALVAYYVPRNRCAIHLPTPPSLTRTAIESQCKALFWDIYLPHGVAEVNDGLLSRCDHPPNWTSVLTELDSNDSVLELSFSALSISRVGRANHDDRLVKEGNRLYGRALKDLQKAFSNNQRMSSDGILAACSVLGLYEIFEGGCDLSKSVGWTSHAEGVANLVRIRGPEKHCERQSHHVFLGARLPILYSAIVRRKRSFLEEEEWITKPFVRASKTGHELIVDKFAKLPRMLEDFDSLRACARLPDIQAKMLDLLEVCRQYQEELTRWDARRKMSSRPTQLQHIKAEIGDTYPFEAELTWENHLFLNASLVYWSAQLIINKTILHLEYTIARYGHIDHISRSGFVSEQDIRQYAIYIVQSVPYALMSDMGALGMNYITFPLSLAFRYFMEIDDERVCLWLSKICRDMRTQGVAIGPLYSPALFGEGLGQELNWDTSVSPSQANPTTSMLPLAAYYRESRWSMSPVTSDSGVSFSGTFIHENPAKYYIDISNITDPP